MRWKPVAGAERIHVEVEQVASRRLFSVDLDGSATSVTLPEGFLKPGLRYTLDVKAASRAGNLSVADIDVTVT